jgi:hypothetical protein
MAYEGSIRDETHPGRRALCLLHPGGWIDARGQLTSLSSNLAAGWRAEQLFFQEVRQNSPADSSHLIEALNRGVGLCVHVGHGSETTWEGGPGSAGPALSSSDLRRLHNADRLPIVFSAGCSTAYFAPLAPYEAYTDVEGHEHAGTYHGEVFAGPPSAPAPYQLRPITEGLGKKLVIDGPNGAVAYLGCNTGGQPCGVTLLEGLLEGLGHSPAAPSPLTIGDCWRNAIAHYYEAEHLSTLRPTSGWYPPSIFFQGMKYMLFGDPTLPL